MMEISQYNSKKIAILNSVAIMLVLLLHSYFVEATDYSMANYIQKFTGTSGLSGVAVPLFYFMSGILFFKSVNCTKDCITGIRKRIFSLLMPYIIWNIVFVGWYMFMSIIPGISGFVNSDLISHFRLDRPFAGLEYLLLEPAGFHLWFMRDLIVYVVFSPLLWLLLKRFPWLTLIGFYMVFGGVPRCGITYFTLGGLVSSRFSLDYVSHVLNRSFVLVCSLLFLLNAVMAVIFGCAHITHNPYWQQLTNTVGIISMWGMYDIVNRNECPGKLSDILSFISKYSFFIYLFHEPVFNIIKKLSLILIGVHEWSLILLYLINPIIMCALALVVAKVFQNYMPRLYSVLVGGR